MKVIACVFFVCCVVVAVLSAGGDRGSNGCIPSAGYTWCAKENKCIRAWELAKKVQMDVKDMAAYCDGTLNSTKVGADESANVHGCIASAGYSWCEKEQKCVKPWALMQEKQLKVSEDQFIAYCSGSKVGADESANAHGCIASAGYSWCETEKKCVKPWALMQEKQLEVSEEQFTAYCSAAEKVGSDESADVHGCITSAGYSWCDKQSRCVRPWDLTTAQNIPATEESFQNFCKTDCQSGSTGFVWCAKAAKCVQPWVLVKEQQLKSSQTAIDAYCAIE
eukprot:TRINITY_DN2220_c0_g1_i1.p1 TRINITY_DN2220_c0_g1~~TRINITY_DN2220_c0_g1_i1.p1  ORF type:complete len:279 (-),score=50.57 TRINITY_DN2220_c0_g1_i1:73-909(-)